MHQLHLTAERRPGSRPMTIQTKDLLTALLVVVVWGVNFIAIKAGVGEVPPLLLGALRFVLAVFPAVLFVRPPKVPLRLYLAYGMTIFVGQFAFLFSAIHSGMPAGLASLVLQSQSFFTLILAAIWLRESWRPTQLLGLAIGGAGLALIGAARQTGMPLVGFALTLAAAVAWAAGNVVGRAVAHYRPNMLALVVWAGLVPPLPFLALSWAIEGRAAMAAALSHFGLHAFGAVAYLAWGATLLGYGLWSRLLGRYPANAVAPFSLLVPVVALAAAAAVYGERLLAPQWAGGALLMLGLAVNVFGARLQTRKPAAEVGGTSS